MPVKNLLLKVLERGLTEMVGATGMTAVRRYCADRRRNGFTLLELLLVVAIISVLAAIAMPLYSGYITRANNERAIMEINQIVFKLEVYRVDHGSRLPDLLEQLGPVMNDPWGRPYQYVLIEGKPLSGEGKVTPRKNRSLHPLNSDYDLYSMGADGESNLALTAQTSHDDIIRANDGAYIGLAKLY